MRVHVQNPANETLFPITPEQWAAAVARAPDMADLEVSYADDDAGFAAALPQADALLTWVKEVHTRIAVPRLALPERLKVIFCTSAGVDRLLPLGEWLPPGVALLNNRGTHAAKAGEFGIMALLMLANHLPVFAHDARAGRWAPRFGSVLAGRTVCVVGLGSLGGAVAAWAKQFGMHVIGVRHSAAPHESCHEVVSQADLETVLPRSEFLVIACPLTPQTQGLFDRRRLALLPQGGKVVNIGRGALWDQEAACNLLDAGHLAGCVTDVAVPEPLPQEHRLWRTPGMFVTPHMSADDPGTYNDRSLDIFFENLRALRQGAPLPNRIRPERGY
ncbi:D-2-hydroxyacid dehydrogenase [Roseomonas sp. GC11]|uniref:D-2-hydroxyacid dehydrogenase n=1 Tax=Roseomonas sp. GC11 TaxID=2950546 RepID=UPI00210C1837|nr:D-2-hydroxyacid dehydrogenase [Roseomonas sp. GC11]MCQ4160560.1 D-2-hydroxyacid dehydrogenase [Roseomonas sp. GC11]